VLKVMLFVITPFVAFFNISRLEIDTSLAAGVALGWIALAGVGALAYVAGRLMRLPRPTRGTVMAVAMQGNTGYLGLPLVATVLGADQLGAAVAYDSLVQGPFLFTVVFGMAAAMGTKAGEGLRERTRAFVTKNPPLIAVALGLVVPDSLAPQALVDVSHVLVYSLVPLGFFAVGEILAGEEAAAGSRRVLPPLSRTVVVTLALRLVAAPAILLAVTAPFLDLPEPYLLLAAMPAGVNGLVIAHTYGLDLRLSAAAIAYSTAVAVAVGVVATVVG
jgi:predicted permease